MELIQIIWNSNVKVIINFKNWINIARSCNYNNTLDSVNTTDAPKHFIKQYSIMHIGSIIWSYYIWKKFSGKLKIEKIITIVKSNESQFYENYR